MRPASVVRLLMIVTVCLATAACSAGAPVAGGSGEFRVLARSHGWRIGLDPVAEPDALLEFAYDRATAADAWSRSVAGERLAEGEAALPAGGPPALDDVDFETEIVAVWSAGQSSSCPAVLEALGFDDPDRVVVDVRVAEDQTACTADASPYTLVLALPATEVPVLGPDEAVPLVGATGHARRYRGETGA